MKTSCSIKCFRIVIVILLISVSASCKSSQSIARQSQEFKNLKNILNSKAFKVDVHTALPFNTRVTRQVLNELTRFTGNNANQIMITGYEVNFKNDSIIGQLPYYGEQQLGGGRYNANFGIVFNNIPKDYSLEKHKKHDAFVMKFNIDDDIESVETYRVIITFFSNNSTDIDVISSHRNTISYSGRLVNLN